MPTRALPVATACVALGMLVAPARAEDAQTLVIGDRVRVTDASTSANRIEGTLVDADANRLSVVQNGTRVVVLRSQVSKLEVLRGRKPHAGTGALIGIGWGVGAALVLSNPVASGQHGQTTKLDGGAVVGGVAVGVLMGAGIGALIHTDRWIPIPKDTLTSLAATSRRGVGLAVRMSPASTTERTPGN